MKKFEAYLKEIHAINNDFGLVAAQDIVANPEPDVLLSFYQRFRGPVSIVVLVGKPEDGGSWYEVSWTYGDGLRSSARHLAPEALSDIRAALTKQDEENGSV